MEKTAVIAILTVVCLTGCVLFENVVRKGFSEEDLIAPLPYKAQNTQKKPAGNYFLPLSYSYNISWEMMPLYAHYQGAFMAEIENTGTHTLFIYGFALKIGDEEQKGRWNSGKEIPPGKNESFICSFTCPAGGNYTYYLGVYFMAGTDGKWHDYGLKYVSEGRTLEVKKYGVAYYTPHKNYYRYFDRINRLVDPAEPALRNQVREITEDYGTVYNIAQVCAIFDWIYFNVPYVNETGDTWKDPCSALDNGGDCEEFAMLMAAMVTAAGGTARVYLTDNHAFAAVYVGSDTKVMGNVDAYYNANLSYALFEDEFGYWVVADPLASFYLGGLPVGGIVTGLDGKYYRWSIVTNDLYSIDVLNK